MNTHTLHLTPRTEFVAGKNPFLGVTSELTERKITLRKLLAWIKLNPYSTAGYAAKMLEVDSGGIYYKLNKLAITGNVLRHPLINLSSGARYTWLKDIV